MDVLGSLPGGLTTDQSMKYRQVSNWLINWMNYFQVIVMSLDYKFNLRSYFLLPCLSFIR